MTVLSRFARDDSGATAVEYGLIAVVILGAVSTAGLKLKSGFNRAASGLS